MKLNKYNVGKKNGYSVSVSGGSSSSSSSDGLSRATEPRTIWGNYDDGGDIEETLFVNGSLYLNGDGYDDNDGDDGKEAEEREFNPREDDGGGNIYASGMVEAKEVYAKDTLYVPHPSTKAKTNINDLLKDYDTKISNNTTNIASNKAEIDALKGRVTTVETNITNISTSVSNNSTAITQNATNIQNNADAIAELQGLVANGLTEEAIKRIIDEMAISKLGSSNNPIVLISGYIYRLSETSNYYIFSGQQNENLGSITCSHKDGLMTLSIGGREGYEIKVTSVAVTQRRSIDSGADADVEANSYLKGRSDGAHWFEAKPDSTYDTKKIYIREFHQGNGDNDTWYSDSWVGGGGVRAANIIATGYIWKKLV